jgi:hypothetical protein
MRVASFWDASRYTGGGSGQTSAEPSRVGAESGRKLNKMKEFRIPPQEPNGSPPIGWRAGKHNLSGRQQLRASEPEAI